MISALSLRGSAQANMQLATGESNARTNVLDVVPVVNVAVRIERQRSGLLLWVPLRQRWWMGPPLSWLLPFKHEKGIALDSLGREVLEACDGKSTIERIVEDFANRHQLRFHEARQSVLMFLKMLVERNVVALVAEPHIDEGSQSDSNVGIADSIRSPIEVVDS